MIKKIAAWLHLWLGLLTGIVVFIVSVTGCIHVFHEEFLAVFPVKATQPIVANIASKGRPLLKPSQIVALAQQQMIKDNAAQEPFMIRYLRDKESLLLFGDNGAHRTWFSFDPYTGEILDQKIERNGALFRVKDAKIQEQNLRGFEFFPFILEGHVNLWLPTEIGKTIVCYSTLLFIVLLISGLILWWPKNKAAAKQRYWFRWKKGTKWRRKNYDLHNINGFYTFLLLIIIAFTGLCIGLTWVSKGLHWMLGGEEELVFYSKVPAPGTAQVPFVALMDRVFEQEEALYPKAHTYSMYWAYPTPKDPVATTMTVVYGKDESYRSHYDRYTQHKIGIEEEEEHESLAHQLEHLYLPIHEGSIGGLTTKILAFVASLISASLPITGFYIWYGRKNKKTKKKISGAMA